MTGAWAFIAVVAVFLWVLAFIWARNHGGRRTIGRRATLAELIRPEDDRLGKPMYRAVTHQTPEHDAVPQITPCCEIPVAGLPPGIRLSHDASEVTCKPGISKEEE